MRTSPSTEAVLITAHRRPDRLDDLLSALTSGERRVYVSIDGVRRDVRPSDSAILQTRAVAKRWQSKAPNLRVRELRESKGLRAAVVSAIDWAFEAESRLIILEDDIRPSPEFFEFCDSALSQYESDPMVGSITGYSDVPASVLAQPSHGARLSCFTSSWGWATWRDRWLMASSSNEAARSPRPPDHIAQMQSRIYWATVAYLVRGGRVDSWAYPWLFTHWRNGWTCLTPQTPLVLNAGADFVATHTHQLPIAPALEELGQLYRTSKPINVGDAMLDLVADQWSNKHHHKAQTGTASRLVVRTLVKK
jgi:hypothetical protein